jgi:hypothetical protein
MRRFIIASALLLAGCATRPQQPVEQPSEPIEQPRQFAPLIGLSAQQLVSRLGRPALQVQEGTGTKLQFRGSACILDAYLYPGHGGVPVVTHVDTRNAAGADVNQASCISVLEAES